MTRLVEQRVVDVQQADEPGRDHENAEPAKYRYPSAISKGRLFSLATCRERSRMRACICSNRSPTWLTCSRRPSSLRSKQSVMSIQISAPCWVDMNTSRTLCGLKSSINSSGTQSGSRAEG